MQNVLYDISRFSAIILAGGESRRMAAPKAWLPVGGVPIILREISALRPLFGEIIIVSNEPEQFDGLGLRVVPDDAGFPGSRGPLIGAYSGIKAASGDYCFLAACDMPFIRPELVMMMAGMCDGVDAVIPRMDNGRVAADRQGVQIERFAPVVSGSTVPEGWLLEPLLGFYARSAVGIIESKLRGGSRRLRDILPELNVKYLDEGGMRVFDPELQSFINVNTPEDHKLAEKIASSQARGIKD